MKKVISLFLSLTMLLSIVSVVDFSAYADVQTGSCGDNVTYSLDTETGVLTISGTGDMYSYGPFYENTNIKSVIIENGVTSIGDGVFQGCTSLRSVTIPDSVTSIGDDAFYGCYFTSENFVNNSNVELDDSSKPTIVDTDAGGFCIKDNELVNMRPTYAIGEITIPDSVTSISDYAFNDCTSLTSVTIPDSVTSIDDWTFSSCTSLTSIEVSGNNKNYSSADGVLFNKDKSELITYPAGKTDSEYVIPNSVISIGDSAFENCTSLTSVTIPDSVTSIGRYTFENCTSLTSVTIPNSVTSIGDDAFYNCTSLTSVTIPDSVTSIGSGAFSNCTSLKSIEVSGNNKSYSSADGVLFNKDKTELITYPAGKTDSEYVIPNSVTSIGYSAFKNCTSLTSVTIPDSVTSIGDYAFCNCTSLTSVTIPDSVTSIGYSAFRGCTSLTSVTIPDSVTSIGDAAFSDCTSLTSLTISDSVTSIGKYAFSGCTSLTSITIPDSVTSISYSAFENCTSLSSVTIGNSVTSIGSSAFYNTAYYNDKYNWDKGVLYLSNRLIDTNDDFDSTTDYTIKDGTRFIADSVFSNCDNLISITIPNSVKSLGDNAFGSVKKVIYNGTDKEFFEIENIENNKNVIVAKYYDLLNDLISKIEVPYKQSEYLKITDDYLYNTIKDRINNNEEARSKKISIKNGEFYINGMDIGELEVQYVYFPQHYDDLNENIERLHKVYCYISSYSMDVKVKFINDSDYNKADEKYVSDFIKTLNIAKPQCYEEDYEEYKMSEIGDWKYNFSVASEYYNKLINDSSIKFVAGSGAGGYCSFLNPGFSEAGVDLAVFKNDVLYGTYYPITNYKDGVNITDEKIIPVMTLPSDLPDNQVENYILQKLKNDWKNESDTILSVKKGAVVNGSQLKDGYVIKIAPGYYEGDYGIIIARKQNNSTSDEKPTPVPTPSPAQQVTQPTAHNDTATTLQAKNTVSKPKSTNTKKIKAAKKAISVTWKKVSGVKGYQIQVATDKKFKKNKKTVTIKKQKTTKTTVKKLKAKKKYYVRVRTYKIVNGKKVYSSWSKVKSVKTK